MEKCISCRKTLKYEESYGVLNQCEACRDITFAMSNAGEVEKGVCTHCCGQMFVLKGTPNLTWYCEKCVDEGAEDPNGVVGFSI